MPTIKVVGCGGRYSAYQFVPCHICGAGNKAACEATLSVVGPQGKHEEYWTVR